MNAITVQQFLLLLLLAPLGLKLARFFGLFRSDEEEKPLELRLLTVGFAFFALLVIAPLLAYIASLLWLLWVEGAELPLEFTDLAQRPWFFPVVITCQLLTVGALLRLLRLPASLFFFGNLPARFSTAVRDFFTGVGSWLLILPTVLLISAMSSLFVVTFFGGEAQEQEAVQQLRVLLERDPSLFWQRVLLIALFIPLIEEILFRGYMHQALRRYLGSAGTVLVAGTLFAVAHYSSSLGVHNIEVLSTLWVLALFLGILHERYGSLWAPIGLHCTFNFGTCLVVWSGAA